PWSLEFKYLAGPFFEHHFRVLIVEGGGIFGKSLQEIDDSAEIGKGSSREGQAVERKHCILVEKVPVDVSKEFFCYFHRFRLLGSGSIFSQATQHQAHVLQIQPAKLA